MDLELRGNVTWVLGASSGLGLACASAFAREGSLLAISSRDIDRLSAAAGQIESEFSVSCLQRPVDVRDTKGMQIAHEEITRDLGSVDILVVNSGGPPSGGVDDISASDFQAAFELVCMSAFNAAKLVLPGMRAQRSGTILFLTSSSTKEVIPNLLLSNVFRVAVTGLAKSLAKDLGSTGIRVLCVAPGRIATDRVAELDEARSIRTGVPVDKVRRASEAEIPQGRYGTVAEFADVVVFLASHRASYVNGSTIYVDGGKLNSL